MADIARTRAFVPAPPWRLIAVALVLIALVVAALFVAGSQRRVAPPFGPARNGEIVYDSVGDLYVGDPETGVTRLLVGGPEVDVSPSYSPDGTRIAFLRKAGCCPQTFDIFAAKADGSDLHMATSSPIDGNAYANWTPDSRHIAIIEYNAEGEGGRLYLLDTEGGEPPLRLAPGMDVRDAVAFRPPNGDQIAFRALVDEGWGLFVMNADGTNIKPLLDPAPTEMGLHATNITYSADGERLFYQSYAPAPFDEDGGCCQLWVMNADGTDAHRFESATETAWTGVPTVSPDGRWVAYWSVLGSSGNQQIRVAPTDEHGPSIGTGPAMSDIFPWAWSPDSSEILMFPDDGSTTSAYLIDPMGGPYHKVPFESGSALDWQRLAP